MQMAVRCVPVAIGMSRRAVVPNATRWLADGWGMVGLRLRPYLRTTGMGADGKTADDGNGEAGDGWVGRCGVTSFGVTSRECRAGDAQSAIDSAVFYMDIDCDAATRF